MRTKIVKNVVSALLIGVLGVELFSPNAGAASLNVTLLTSKDRACSAQLGNTTGAYGVDSRTYDGKYSTDFWFYYGPSSDHCGQYQSTPHWVLAPYGKKDKVFNINRNNYTTARVTLYGNIKQNRMKGCHSFARFYNN